MSMGRHPADLLGGITNNQGKICNAFDDNSTCANEGVLSNVMATNDGRIGPNRSPSRQLNGDSQCW